jgi:hypothetical protein
MKQKICKRRKKLASKGVELKGSLTISIYTESDAQLTEDVMEPWYEFYKSILKLEEKNEDGDSTKK